MWLAKYAKNFKNIIIEWNKKGEKFKQTLDVCLKTLGLTVLNDVVNLMNTLAIVKSSKDIVEENTKNEESKE